MQNPSGSDFIFEIRFAIVDDATPQNMCEGERPENAPVVIRVVSVASHRLPVAPIGYSFAVAGSLKYKIPRIFGAFIGRSERI